jgi:hypothetical protein
MKNELSCHNLDTIIRAMYKYRLAGHSTHSSSFQDEAFDDSDSCHWRCTPSDASLHPAKGNNIYMYVTYSKRNSDLKKLC